MSDPVIKPVCMFDVDAEGCSVPIDASWPTAPVRKGIAYRWLHFDIADPSFEKWTQEFLPASAQIAIRQTETRPRCDFMDGGLAVNLRGVNLNPGADADDMVSLRLWVTNGLIVSSRRRKILAMNEMRLQMEHGKGPASIGMFLAELAFGLIKRIENVAVELEEDADEIEEEAITRPQEVSGKVAQCRQSVIKLRRFIRPQKEALIELINQREFPLEKRAVAMLRETVNRTTRTVEALDATHDRLSATQDHLDILHSSALGRNSYVLSVVAAIFLPLGFLTGLFGINVGGMPGTDSPHGFWIVTVGSVVIGIALFAIFRFSKWL